MLDPGGLDLEEIGNALADQTDYEHRRLIDPRTGEIVFWTADTGIDGQTPVDLDELDLVCIDPLPSWVWYQDMADFAETITNERAGRRLLRAIQGRGAFRRFKDELLEEYPDLLPAWYAFRDARARRRAVQWLADNSFIDDAAADRLLAGHPDPDLPRAPPMKRAVNPSRGQNEAIRRTLCRCEVPVLSRAPACQVSMGGRTEHREGWLRGSSRGAGWRGSGDLELFVAEVGDELEGAAEGGDVAVQDVLGGDVAAFDLGDPGD